MTSGTYCLRELAPREVYHALCLTKRGGELLPHLFTLTPEEAVYFLLHFLYLPKQTLSYAYWIAEHGTCWCPDFPPWAPKRPKAIVQCIQLKIQVF